MCTPWLVAAMVTLLPVHAFNAASADETLEIFGLEFGKAPVAKHPRDLPDLYEPAVDAPGKWSERKDVFPLPLAEGIWLKYPATRGKFFIEYRADRQKPETERTYGPFEGDPFEKLGLEEKMRARLQRGYSPDDYYRLRLMFRTGEKQLATRAARLIAAACEGEGEAYERESSIGPLREILTLNAADFARHGLQAQAEVAEKKLAALVQTIDDLTLTLPDDKYLPGEAADSLPAKSAPAEAWSKPNKGLSFALLPTAKEVALGDSLAVQIIAKNTTDAPLKFSMHDLMQGARPSIKDAAGKDVMAGMTFFTGLSPVQHYLLKPGEVLILVAPTLRFLLIFIFLSEPCDR